MIDKKIEKALEFHFVIPVTKDNILKGDKLLYNAICEEKDLENLSKKCIEIQKKISTKILHTNTKYNMVLDDEEISTAINYMINNISCEFSKNELLKLNSGKKKLLRSKIAKNIMSSPNYSALGLIELFHLATLIQDDIIDNGKVRRHMPTINHTYDDFTALMVSDILLCQIFIEFRKLIEYIAKDKNIPKEIETNIKNKFNELIFGMLESEQNNQKIKTLKEYEKSSIQKTGKLFGLSFIIGCLFNDSLRNEKEIKRYYEYGCNLGLIFQKIDDYLDVYFNVDKLGKNSEDNKNSISNFATILMTQGYDQKQIYDLIECDLANLEKDKISYMIKNEINMMKEYLK